MSETKETAKACRIYLMRHGETNLNAEKRFRGMTDCDLSARGFEQARLMGQKLKHVHFDYCICSPLIRAVHTAETVLSQNEASSVSPIVVPELTSMKYGDWEGRKEAEIAESEPERWAQFTNAIETVDFPGGESLAKLCARASAAVAEAVSKHQGNILVVTHQVVTRTLLCHYLNMPDARGYWRIGQETACLNLVDVTDGKTVVQAINISAEHDPIE
ncbi:Histidine phosphatase superfamily [Carpediemonas membranifera]|uniref:phosphoglycerate mutase (2,3-diphosphoglycerate-dependent) n=1 Tax=Carpediemonas membranifera TaxID=201153 RepID=A0A8J6BZD1_9EUKA|nr:Histidine phosphatase superfamily [Carpediemonas membranifera]|eukprot:KAG9395406.1 Histidine phosphatase superfamily [Carpediemonas membranifera]